MITKHGAAWVASIALALAVGAVAGYQLAPSAPVGETSRPDQRVAAAATELAESRSREERLQERVLRQDRDLAQMEGKAARAQDYSQLLYDLAVECKASDPARHAKLLNVLADIGSKDIQSRVRPELAAITLKEARALLDQGMPAAALWNARAAFDYDPTLAGLDGEFARIADAAYSEALRSEAAGKPYDAVRNYYAIWDGYEHATGQPFRPGVDLEKKLRELRTPEFYEACLASADRGFEESGEDPGRYPGYYHDYSSYASGRKEAGQPLPDAVKGRLLKSLENLCVNRITLGYTYVARTTLDAAKKSYPELGRELAEIEARLWR